jgi:hypothetical protein
VSATTTIKAKGFKAGWTNSDTGAATYTIPQATTENVIWTNTFNVTVTGNSVQKTSGSSAAWDGGGVSTRAIAGGDGYVEFTATEVDRMRAFGLGYGDSSRSLSDIEFAILLEANSYFQVYESGVARGPRTMYASGDRFRIAVEGGQVRYRRNNVIFYTSTLSPTYPLVADAAMYELLTRITNAVISGALQASDVVSTPTFTPGAGSYTSAVPVVVSVGTPGAVIHYTTALVRKARSFTTRPTSRIRPNRTRWSSQARLF